MASRPGTRLGMAAAAVIVAAAAGSGCASPPPGTPSGADGAGIPAEADGARTEGAASDSAILSGRRVGPVTAGTSRVDLHRLHPDAVRDGPVGVGEGFCLPGTLLFPGTPDEILVAWSDSAGSRPDFLRLERDGSRWRTPAGITVGTSLRELEEIRGGPVSFWGFGWDYGGTIRWDDVDGPLILRIGPAPGTGDAFGEVLGRPGGRELLGERLVSSDHPLLEELELVVRSLQVDLGPAGPVTFCG